MHIMIWKAHPMSKHLKGIERRIYLHLASRAFPLDSIGKAEEQRITRSKDHDIIILLVLLKYLAQRYSDIYPYGIFWQEVPHYLMMPLSTRKHLPSLDNLHHLWREPLLSGVGYADYRKRMAATASPPALPRREGAGRRKGILH